MTSHPCVNGLARLSGVSRDCDTSRRVKCSSARSRSAGALLLAALLAYAAAPRATVLYARPVEALARDADAVVVATPAAARHAFWQGRRIFTDVTVSVDVVITGRVAAPSTVTVRLPGGTVGEVGQSLAGAPSLEAGAPVVLFLSAPHDGVRSVLSLSAGVLPLAMTAAGPWVRPARTEGLTLLPDPSPAPPPRVVVPPEGMALTAFASRLREALR